MKLTLKGRRRRIHNRVRKKISGTPARPRLAVYRSSKSIYAQIIDDLAGHTLASASSLGIKGGTKTEQATQVGQLLAERAKAAGVEGVVFDRGGFLYHGRIKALAEGAREGGLQF